VSRDEALDPRLALLHARRTVSRLGAPGPDPAALTAMLAAADTAPDHGRLRPWRFVVVTDDVRERLADAYAAAAAARGEDPEAVARARSKPLRGPCLVAAIARTVPHPKVPAWEQLVAAGCAVQNLCLAATALGFGSAWRTGSAVEDPGVRAVLGLSEDERLIGLVHLGTPEV
jgi:nitroreductase